MKTIAILALVLIGCGSSNPPVDFPGDDAGGGSSSGGGSGSSSGGGVPEASASADGWCCQFTYTNGSVDTVPCVGAGADCNILSVGATCTGKGRTVTCTCDNGMCF